MATETAERPRARRDSQDKTVSRRTLALIDQGMTIKTPKVIWEHEIPLLEELHQTDITVVEDPVRYLDEGFRTKQPVSDLQHNKQQDELTLPSVAAGIGSIFVGNAEEEWGRLALVYGRCVDKDELVVERVYGRAKSGRLGQLLGHPDLSDLPDFQLRQLILGTGYVVDVSKDTPAEERPAILAQRKKWLAMGHADLVALAKEQGVSLG
jgi:hypothetical protein